MNKLLQILETEPTPTNALDETTAAISNFCGEEPFPQWKEVLPALPALYVVTSSRCSEIALGNALWALAYIIDASILLRFPFSIKIK